MSTTPVQPADPARPAPAGPAPRPPVSVGTTRLLRRLHFYAGILVAPFLLIATISGGLYALAPTAEKVIYRAQLHAEGTGPAQSIAAQIDAARAARPDLTVTAVRPAPAPGDTTRVLFADPGLPDSTSLAVFVDPATLKVQGELPTYGSSGSLPVRTWIDGVHRNLQLGETGRLYSEFAASWLWVIALAGVALWVIGRRKRRRATGTGHLLIIDRSRSVRERTLNRHAVLGMWIVVVLLFLSATGLTWSRLAGANITELRQSLGWTQPSVSTSLAGAPAAAGGHEGHGDHGGASLPQDASAAATAAAEAGYADTALALARSAGVGRSTAVQISIPEDAQTAFTVTEVRDAWQFSPDSAAVDPRTGTVVDVNRFADWPLMARAANLGIALHMGILFGLLNQIVLALVAVILTVMIVFGYRMWWQRRRRGTHRPGRAPARGALRELPWPAIAVIAAVAVAVGWFVPLLGWPLLAFLAVDVAAGLWQRRRPAH
ncbi:PepSY-associated TM helix domain-containing protein [Gordonia sp. VNK21]|uniref:PepSY-associated TM helix domain-containing protein n=1 Tax=Gordonia sp. VNK21 TaxID=3382483 RepID=UPI0038D44965